MESKSAGSARGSGSPEWISLASRVAAGSLVLLLGVLVLVGTVLADTQYTVQPGDTLSGIANKYGVTVDSIVSANKLPGRSTIYAGQVLTIPSANASATPTAQSLQPTPTSGGTAQPSVSYTVQPGDGFYAIARQFGISVESLLSANGLTLDGHLVPGQVLKIPGVTPVPATSTPTSTFTPTPQPTAQATATSSTSTSGSQSQGASTTTTPQPAASGTPEAGKPVKYTVQWGDTLSGIAAKFNTTVDAISNANNLDGSGYLDAGQVLTIIPGDDQSTGPKSGGAANSTPTPPPTPPVPMGKYGPKWIEVDLSSQTLVAYEGQTPVYSTLISSGVYRHPTVIGTFRTYLKYRYQEMIGGVGAEHYDLPNVPDVMYFYADYSIHGAYWHHNFGNPMSHGCVNTPLPAGHWLYQWAPLGTVVVVHY